MDERGIRAFVKTAADALPGAGTNPDHTKLFNSAVAELAAQFLVDVNRIANARTLEVPLYRYGWDEIGGVIFWLESTASADGWTEQDRLPNGVRVWHSERGHVALECCAASPRAAAEMFRLHPQFEESEDEALLRVPNEQDINALVERFLTWPLPKSVCADLCATDSSYAFPRSGTNLLSAVEAKQMIEYLLAASQPAPADVRRQLTAAADYLDDLESCIVAADADMVMKRMKAPSVVADELRALAGSPPSAPGYEPDGSSAPIDAAPQPPEQAE